MYKLDTHIAHVLLLFLR